MKNRNLKIGLLGVGTVLFHALFWGESLGINLLLFCLFIILGNGLLKESKWNKKMLATLAGLVLSLGSVFFINSTISLIAAITSLIVFVGFIHHETLRFNWSSLLTIFISVFQLPKLELSNSGFTKIINVQKWKRKFKLIFLPIIILIVFTLIFRVANPVFDSYLESFETWLGDFIGDFFVNLSLSSILFFVIGFFLTAALIIKSTRTYFVKRDAEKSEDIVRKRKTKRIIVNHYTTDGITKSKMSYPSIPILGLKNERFSAIVMLGLVGVLLLIVNTIDIVYVWFSKTISTTQNLTEMVHEGTYLLIFSIVLSMLIMLYIFRRNQNFYAKSKVLKQLAYVWIVQNSILVISVAIRNHNYISEYGLTHKRIGVYIFLFLTIVGLIFLYLKIKDKKSVYYLMLNNSWAVYTMLVFMGMVNWDGLIVTYNINYVKESNIDFKYLVQLSDNALIGLDKKTKDLDSYGWNRNQYFGRRQSLSSKEYFNNRINTIQNKKPQSLLSWNYSTYRNQQYFKTN